MSIETKVELTGTKTDSLFKSQKIRVGTSKSFETPVKAIDLRTIRQKHNIDTSLKELNEIFRRVDSKKVKDYNSDPEIETKFTSSIQTDLNKIDSSKNSKLCFIEYDDKNYPNNAEIETIINISHSYSDITPLPILNFVNLMKMSDTDFDRYKKFVSESIESIEQLNNKPVMGIIPFIPTIYIEPLIKFYTDKGINSFSIDLNGKNPIVFSPRLRKILISIKNHKPLEECYIHSFNMNIGRTEKTAQVVPAKDILGLYLGFGSIGNKYKKFKPNKAFIELMKKTPHTFRVFNKDDYGYWRYLSEADVKSRFLKHSKIDPTLFDTSKDKIILEKLLNNEQLSLEAMEIRETIKQEPDKVLDYLKSKNKVIEDDYNKITNFKQKYKLY